MPIYRSVNKILMAPFAELEVISPDSEEDLFPRRVFLCDGLLDTGAPCTYIPERILVRLGIQAFDVPEIASGIGGEALYKPYIASLGLEGRIISNVRVFGWERDMALVGRDILNEFHICFDGIKQSFDSL